jgi:hypothetical protein
MWQWLNGATYTVDSRKNVSLFLVEIPIQLWPDEKRTHKIQMSE